MKFKPGPAKTRDGRDAVIYEVEKDVIFGRIGAYVYRWVDKGGGVAINNYDSGRDDLLSNSEPFRFEAKVWWREWPDPPHFIYPDCFSSPTSPFPDIVNKHGTLVFTEDVE